MFKSRHNLNWLHDYLGSAGGSGGEGGAGGQCPAAGPKSEEECAGSIPNCWSPGKDSVPNCWSPGKDCVPNCWSPGKDSVPSCWSPHWYKNERAVPGWGPDVSDQTIPGPEYNSLLWPI